MTDVVNIATGVVADVLDGMPIAFDEQQVFEPCPRKAKRQSSTA
jgi:hypothetical protein